MIRAYATIRTGQVHYQTEGSGEPLLLLHQTPVSSDTWTKMAPLLANHYRVIAMDTLGYGKSDPPPRQYDMADYSQSVVDFLAALGISRASIVGRHTGACIAAEVAAGHPGVVDKLVLFGGPNYPPELRRARLNTSDPAFRPMELKEDGSHIMTAWRSLVAPTDPFGPDKGPRPLPIPLEELHVAFVARMAAGTRAEDAHHAVWTYDVESRLPLIKCPTLLLTGDKDYSYDRLELTRKLIPRCRTGVIKGGDTFTELAKAEEAAQAILSFLKDPGV